MIEAARLILYMSVVGWGVSAAGCSPRGEAGVAEATIAAVLDDWHAAAAAADEARYFGHLSEDAVFLGTDANERWSKAAFRAYAHPHFAKGRAWAFKAVRRDIVVREGASLAWFDEDLATQNLGPARGSGVLVRRGGRWLIAQYNLALTIPNARFDLVKEAAAAEVLAAADGDALADLAWLAGSWVVVRDGSRVEETWTTPGGGMLLGVGRTLDADGMVVFFEHLRIEVRDGVATYVAQPRGGAPTMFGRVASEAGSAVFENLAHDWPKRIAYRRSPEGLEVKVEGGPGEPVDTWVYRPALIERSP